ncbi:hypothetical protein [Bacillus taeanensis]|nr:hypothetical protein [Bacillus taeanensis]
MSNSKKRENRQSGSQKGKPYSEAMGSANVLSEEELSNAISPTKGQNTPQ